MVGLDKEWKEATQGDVVEADVYLERYGNVTVLSNDYPLFLRQERGVNYQVACKVKSIDKDLLQVDCGDIHMTIDLDIGLYTSKVFIPTINVGAVIGLTGVLTEKIDY